MRMAQSWPWDSQIAVKKNKKVSDFFRRCNEREVIYFPYVVRKKFVIKKKKAVINCPKIVVYTVKIMKFLVHIISEHLQKPILLRFKTETVGPCLVRKLKWGAMAPCPPSSSFAPVSHIFRKF